MSATAPRVHIETVEEWRAWLESCGDQAGVWVVTWKQRTGKPKPSYDELVTEALAFGWVDSTGGTVDDERSEQYFARRKPRSGWSRPNKERVARLEREGRMTPAGAAVIAAAKENGSWSLLDDVENLIVPDDLGAALDAIGGARAHWDAFPRSARRAMLEWLVQAKRPETRLKRITAIAENAGKGLRSGPVAPR